MEDVFEAVSAMFSEDAGELIVHRRSGGAFDFTVLQPLSSDDGKRCLPLRFSSATTTDGCDCCCWTVVVEAHRAPWLSRAAASHIGAALRAHWESGASELGPLGACDWAANEAPAILAAFEASSSSSSSSSQQNQTPQPKQQQQFLREWELLPMLQSREKRRELADFAPRFGITGFVMAGKPSVICLEGRADSVASFLGEIRSVSWASIPSCDKKLTTMWQERFAVDSDQELESHRLFPGGLSEISFDLHGHRSNRPRLSQLEQWLIEHGCPDAFRHLFPALSS